jgi:hypothetical protein
MNAEKFERWLIEKNACADGKAWAKGKSMVEVWKTCERPDWIMWLYARRPNPDKKKAVKIAIFAAELVLDKFEKNHTDDKRPRQAIAAAKAVVKKDTPETRAAATAAAAAAYAAYAYAAYADADAAYAAYAAADAAYAYAYADAAADAAAYAAYAAADAADADARADARAECRKKQCSYIRKLIPRIR